MSRREKKRLGKGLPEGVLVRILVRILGHEVGIARAVSFERVIIRAG